MKWHEVSEIDYSTYQVSRWNLVAPTVTSITPIKIS